MPPLALLALPGLRGLFWAHPVSLWPQPEESHGPQAHNPGSESRLQTRARRNPSPRARQHGRRTCLFFQTQGLHDCSPSSPASDESVCHFPCWAPPNSLTSVLKTPTRHSCKSFAFDYSAHRAGATQLSAWPLCSRVFVSTFSLSSKHSACTSKVP